MLQYIHKFLLTRQELDCDFKAALLCLNWVVNHTYNPGILQVGNHPKFEINLGYMGDT